MLTPEPKETDKVFAQKDTDQRTRSDGLSTQVPPCDVPPSVPLMEQFRAVNDMFLHVPSYSVNGTSVVAFLK